jgi:hypothetical protein
VVLGQDEASLFLVTSLTGYSSRRNQFITQLLFHMEYLFLARHFLNLNVVAPTFVLNARNHSEYEHAIRAVPLASAFPFSWRIPRMLGDSKNRGIQKCVMIASTCVDTHQRMTCMYPPPHTVCNDCIHVCRYAQVCVEMTHINVYM